MNTTMDSRAGLVFSVQPPEKLIKQLPNHLEKVEDSIMNNLQLESLNFEFVWESYDDLKMRKIGEKFWRDFKFFFLKMNGKEFGN